MRDRRNSLAERRKGTDAYTARARIEWTEVCPNTIVEDKMAGVSVRIVTPEGLPESNRDKVLLNLHGGGSIRIRDRTPSRSDCQLYKDQGGRGALPPGARVSVSRGGG